ncbi:SusE domain-containing protein [Hymenobacter psychrophilus]|uniref:SusE outer membrane protein n=1 Tax=Hymenobacter psychrophilus TaxID=651662 RepID=A0A1H3BIM3_9BACT|nr:SusE domain-containing protein [Hymenobacter psychrophilus]SDX41578.1 SusE outer membrane protein [Hymenobacter psychrophilus]
MKNLFTKLTGLSLVAALFLTSCEKEGDKIMLTQTAAPQLQASTTTPVLSRANADKDAVTYTWTPTNYGFAAGPNYTLEFDTKGNNFKSARTISVGTATTRTLTVSELNSIYSDLKRPAGEVSELEVRLQSMLLNNAGLMMSNLTGIKATPYESRELPQDVWAIIGDATTNGWGTETPMTYDFDRRVWTITLPLTAAYYKFRANNDWGLNLGALSDGDATKTAGPLKEGGSNIKISEAGTYTVTLNYSVKPATYTAVKQ